MKKLDPEPPARYLLSQGKNKSLQYTRKVFHQPLAKLKKLNPMANPIRILDRLLVRLAVALIHLYRALGPLKRFFLLAPSPCRYQPTCSHYALESFQAHPFLKALYLSIRRILRCHPFSKGGYDPVPPSKD